MKKHIKRFCVNLHKRFFFAYHTFVDEIAGNFDSCSRGTLTVTGLQHIKFFVFDGEFHILHIAVMVFESFADFLELCVSFGEYFLHLLDRHRRTYACNDVFTLCVYKEFAHKSLFACCGITRERNAGTGSVAQIAERHHLYVYGSTPRIGNVVVHTVNVCTGIVPRTEYRFNRFEKLFFGIVGEIFAELFLIFGFKLVSKFFKVVGGEVNVEFDTLLSLHFVDKFFKVFLADFHNDVGEHLDKSSVTVPSPAGIARFSRNSINNVFVKTEIEYGVHHTGHRSSCAGTYRHEQGVDLIAELLAADLFHFVNVGHNFFLNAVVDFTSVFIVLRAGFGRDSEALRYGKTDFRHFSEVCTLTAEKLAHTCFAFGEEIAIFFCH